MTPFQIKAVVTEILGTIARRPDQVTVTMVESGNDSAILLLTVHPSDLREILGQEGRILRALRTLVCAVAAKNNISLQLQVEATQPPPNPALQSTLDKPSFDEQPLRE